MNSKENSPSEEEAFDQRLDRFREWQGEVMREAWEIILEWDFLEYDASKLERRRGAHFEPIRTKEDKLEADRAAIRQKLRQGIITNWF